jgi:hypothetical protein
MTYNPSKDAHHETFFKWVGICISEWASIEHWLFLLCGTVLYIDPKLVSIIYYNIPTLSGRIRLVDDLLETVWSKKPGEHHPREQTWKSIRKGIDELAKERNFLAHASPVPKFNLESSENSPLSSLGMMKSRWENLKTGRAKFITQDAMEQHSALVHALSEELRVFFNQMGRGWPEKWNRYKPPPKRGAKKQVHRQRRDNNVVVLDPTRR